MVQLASAMDTVNDFIDSRGVLGALLVAAITTGVGLAWRNRRPAREISWSVEYVAPLNQGQGDPNERTGGQGGGAQGDPTKDPSFWDIQFRGRKVVDGSLVLLRVQSSGPNDIGAEDFADPLTFTFPDRGVLGFKVRDNKYVHREVENSRQLPSPATAPPPAAAAPVAQEQKPEEEQADEAQPIDWTTLPREIVLPKFQFNKNTEFKLLVLLAGHPSSKIVEDGGVIADGRIVRHEARRPPYRLLAVGTALAVLIAGLTLGVRLANDALTPNASCASGQLTLQGSSAFAPVANQVRNSYRQLCGNGATIEITADGSDRGLGDLERSRGSATIAMSDGLPASALAASGLTRRPVGVVSFAVVANTGLRATLPDLFTPNGISADELRSLFSGNGAALSTNLVAVGRTHASGTRSAFAGAFFGGTDPEPQTAPACTPAISSGFCVSDNTMDLLSFVNSHPNAIGYAEADALPYFPDVQVVAVDGQTPSEPSVVSGAYPFVATEYLYTADRPAGLVADFLDFLTSPAEIVALRGHGFIACADLHGTKLDGACDG